MCAQIVSLDAIICNMLLKVAHGYLFTFNMINFNPTQVVRFEIMMSFLVMFYYRGGAFKSFSFPFEILHCIS